VPLAVLLNECNLSDADVWGNWRKESNVLVPGLKKEVLQNT